ncbi:MAG: aminoglycoside phosphotransferase family protein [Dehalococcoidia bacterium]
MCAAKMHEDEFETDPSLVRRLLAAQFPQWADLPIERIASTGTDYAIYRLGDDMAVRLPRIHWATAQPEKEQRWLPKLAPHLPLAVPVPIATGNPGEGYPWHWSVVPWMHGDAWAIDRVGDLCEAAADLARFITALQQIDTTGGPPAGPENGFRGVPLSTRDAGFRAAVAAAGDMVDAGAMIAAWKAALAAPEWDGPPVWVHGDLSRPGNLIVAEGRLSAVIDFGCLGVGDPACELAPAWSLFSGESRDVLRAALPFDDATWARGRGWALRAVGAFPYYKDTNPAIVAEAQHTIAEVLADHGAG